MSDDINDPFKMLQDDLKKPSSIDLSSLLKSNRRNKDRIPLDGQAIIYSLDGKVLSPAVLRNVSPGGLGFEVKNIAAANATQVTVENVTQVTVAFGGSGLNIGIVKCNVQWISQIEGHAQGAKMLGLQFASLTTVTKQKLDSFFEDLKKLAEKSA